MMKRLFWMLCLAPLAIILISIAVANRQDVSLFIDPFSPKDPSIAINLPFFVYIFAAMMLGVLLGGIVTWLGGRRWRQSAKKNHMEARRWRLKAEQLEPVAAHKALERRYMDR